MSNQQVVDLMEHVWSSIESLCSSFDEVQWKIKTSYLKGYVQSKKNEPNIYSKLRSWGFGET